MRYIYTCKCGHTKERIVPLSEFKERIKCPKCKGRMGINIPAQQSGMIDTPSNWPMESDALGVHPDQAREYAEYLKRSGVPTEVNSEGNPILTSRQHRRQLCEVTGHYDRDAGYGDKAPEHYHTSRQERKRRFEDRKRFIKENINAGR
jgi:ssDNA-binding Zn-finger/Zn-ribbon topoisomerase 1